METKWLRKTLVGKYNPARAIAFYESKAKTLIWHLCDIFLSKTPDFEHTIIPDKVTSMRNML